MLIKHEMTSIALLLEAPTQDPPLGILTLEKPVSSLGAASDVSASDSLGRLYGVDDDNQAYRLSLQDGAVLRYEGLSPGPPGPPGQLALGPSGSLLRVDISGFTKNDSQGALEFKDCREQDDFFKAPSKLKDVRKMNGYSFEVENTALRPFGHGAEYLATSPSSFVVSGYPMSRFDEYTYSGEYAGSIQWTDLSTSVGISNIEGPLHIDQRNLIWVVCREIFWVFDPDLNTVGAFRVPSGIRISEELNFGVDSAGLVWCHSPGGGEVLTFSCPGL